ncbi:MAG TPA: PP2C family serine/threonine-protein phosphatase [Tepidiformaceae bacterium]|nr:PP2C family serine/threonine-protein phosphatase [Tepidiformaceae bacterium]
MSVTFQAIGRSDVGRVRTNNEDNAAISTIEREGGNYDAWLVADGMGGLAHGEVASELAVRTVIAHLQAVASFDDPGQVLQDAIFAANAAVFQRGTAAGELNQSAMGTTLVVVLVEESTARYWVANVGDSRVYLLSGAGLSQVTHDHSLVADRVRLGEITEEEARTARHRNVITRAIGVEARVEPEVAGPFRFQDGQRLLLCSDGLHGMVTDAEIAMLAGGAEVENVPDRLIDAANAAGGRDNVTVVVGTMHCVVAAPASAAAGPGAVDDSTALFVSRESRGPGRGLVAIGSIAVVAIIAAGIWLSIALSGGGGSTSTHATPPVGGHQQSNSNAPANPTAEARTPQPAPTRELAPPPTATPSLPTPPTTTSG